MRKLVLEDLKRITKGNNITFSPDVHRLIPIDVYNSDPDYNWTGAIGHVGRGTIKAYKKWLSKQNPQ